MWGGGGRCGVYFNLELTRWLLLLLLLWHLAAVVGSSPLLQSHPPSVWGAALCHWVMLFAAGWVARRRALSAIPHPTHRSHRPSILHYLIKINRLDCRMRQESWQNKADGPAVTRGKHFTHREKRIFFIILSWSERPFRKVWRFWMHLLVWSFWTVNNHWHLGALDTADKYSLSL